MTSDSTVREAGAIATRLLGNSPQVLLIQAKTTLREWILPKGHVEPGETPATAALRELREEAGVDGDLVQFVDTLEFTARAGQLRVDYFLIRFRSTSGTGEPNRNPTWYAFDQAIQLVPYAETQRLLEKAREIYVRSLA